MGILDIFRRPPPIADLGSLAEFIDGNAAFLVQRGIYEYSRARAGHYAKVLFREPEFLQEVERARWRAYPLGLAMVGELVEGVLRPHVGEHRRQAHDRLTALILSRFDRYPLSPTMIATEWEAARHQLSEHLKKHALHAPKLMVDVAEPFARPYFDLMPIHKKLRASDFLPIRAYLKATLCNIHEKFEKSADGPALARALINAPADAPVTS